MQDYHLTWVSSQNLKKLIFGYHMFMPSTVADTAQLVSVPGESSHLLPAKEDGWMNIQNRETEELCT